jgi:cytochrome o ubiquinol oxidase subunit 2
MFNPQGPVALQEHDLMLHMVLIMLIVVIPVSITLFVFAWNYRAGNPNAKHDSEQPYSIAGELVLWLIPAVIVAALWILTWQSAHRLDPYNPIQSSAQPITIEVIALPWKWLFIYPAQNIATVNFIEFPVNTPVHFELTADAPMSSFWIPQLGTQIYAMAGMETQLTTMASTIGEFTGKDTEINGTGYAGMTFVAKSTSQDDFNTWVQSIKQTSGIFDLASYTALSQPSQNNPVASYSSVNGDLFNSILMKFMNPSTSSGQAPTSTAVSDQTMPMAPGMHM